MTAPCYLLRKIAIALSDESIDEGLLDDSYFHFRNNLFMKHADYDFEQLLTDLKKDREFKLKSVKSTNGSNCEFLYICYSRWINKVINHESRTRLLPLAFENIAELSLKEVNLQINKMSLSKCFYISARLYEMLREAHNNDNACSTDAAESVQHHLLKPKLRPYQCKAVQWMLYRERTKESIPQIYEAIRCKELPEKQFFLNKLDLDVLDFDPADILFPSGGLLADEMGLGKTVEMIALILLNPRTIPEDYFRIDLTNKKIKLERSGIFCVCPFKKGRNLVTCVKCGIKQHKRCVCNYVSDPDVEHICPNCWETMEIVESSATIIVSPQPIKMQWSFEIQKHVNKSMKILNYEGVAKMKWISPRDLAQYDVVLVDYNTLSREIHFSTYELSCELRKPKSYMRAVSPLTMIRWWRVCLDEAQMVESSLRNHSLMVKTLPTFHRWAVSGTPIQKSIDDLRGILEFLDAVPFFERSTFGSLVSLFQAGDTQPLLDILKKVMWRTCKSTVLDELGIPPQSEKVHYVDMSDIEKLFYQSQHLECAAAFEEKARKLAAHSTHFSKMDPKTLKLLLDPLIKIRQDCTVPLILQKTEQSSVKKLLQPKELLEHLKSTNETECKVQLRTIASSYNGMAALHFLRGEIPEAIKMYEAVLRRAKEYTGAVSVDSLLQIHAIHNMVEAYQTRPKTIKLLQRLESHKDQCSKLEWKYIETYYNDLCKAELNYNSCCKAVSDAAEFINMQELGNWWRFKWNDELIELQEQLIARINDERKSSYTTSFYDNFSSFFGIDYFLTVWFEKVISGRKNVVTNFESLKEFKDKIKPKNELSPEDEKEIIIFVKKAFECHLNLNLENKEEPKKVSKKLCELCEAKKSLNNYECIIFDKMLVDNTEITEGSWNPSFQETTMKILFHFIKLKKINEEYVRQGEKYLQFIDCIKKEYKELVKLWIETEYTVKAYDELNMCKLRLQTATPDNEKDKQSKTTYIISEEEVDQNFMELRSELQIAEITFVRKSARLKYIQHLESNPDPEVCPICNLKPDSKYSVLECGHHLCFECLANLRKYQRNILTCSVCRNQQKYEDIYYVTCKPTSTYVDKAEIKGHFSSKVEEVVRSILELQKTEKDVKILIFSQWDTILRYIGKALSENNISYNLRSSTSNKAIDKFKDENLQITCLLLLLALGSKGLNLTEATHVFLVEPILNPGEELQAINRIHRIGQTKPTTVHRFICKGTVEEQIFNTVSKDKTKIWELNDITIDNIRVLFSTNSE